MNGTETKEYLQALQTALDALVAILDSKSTDPADLKRIAAETYDRLIYTPEYLAKRNTLATAQKESAKA